MATSTRTVTGPTLTATGGYFPGGHSKVTVTWVEQKGTYTANPDETVVIETIRPIAVIQAEMGAAPPLFESAMASLCASLAAVAGMMMLA